MKTLHPYIPLSDGGGTAIRLHALAVLLTFPFFLCAQNDEPPCGFGAAMQAALAQHPQLAAVMEQSAQNYVSDLAQRQGPSTDLYLIPTVFHIIHNNGPENIGDAQVIQALEQANEQLAGQFGGTDTRVKLVLAKVSPDGDCSTTAINRVQHDPPDIDGTTEVQIKNLSRWDPSKYLNVWVLRSLGGNIAGVAHFPETATPETDGIVIRYSNFGTTGAATGNVVNTLVHELGHYLGLYHVWGKDELGPGDNACHNCDSEGSTLSGDMVPDTAPCCKELYDSQVSNCSPPDLYCKEVCDCNTIVHYPIENYMSYVHSCQNGITEGQANRMYYYLDQWRPGLWSYDNLVCTGVGAHPPDFRKDTVEWTTSNLPNGGDIFIFGDLIVPAKKTLIIHAGVTVRFCETGRLVIRPDARLVLRGTLTGMACTGNTWQGVRVEGSGPGQAQWPTGGVWQQGRLSSHQDAVIENAVVGIRTYGDDGKAGGIVSCNSTTFRNCARSVEIAPFENFLPFNGQPRNYSGSFYRCDFVVDQNYPHSAPFHSFVHLTGVNGIALTGCSYSNVMDINGQDIADWGFGIHANDAGFSVSAAADGNTYPPASYTNSEFKGLGYGIYTAKILENRPFQVRQADFNNCFVGLRNRGVSGATILFNNFNLGEVPSAAVTTEQSVICFEGGISGFTCQENVFTNTTGTDALTTIGIFCDNTGDFSKEIRKNTFTGVTVGNLANGQNGANPVVNPDEIRGLNYLCNRNFDIIDAGAEFDVASGWVRGKQGKVNPQSVLGHDAAGNELSPTGTDFINSGGGDIEYFYDPFSNNQTPISIIGNVTPTPGDPNECPTEYCEPPCKHQYEIDIIKTGYHDRKGDYLAAQADYMANPTEGKLLEMAGHRQAMDEAAYMVVIHQLYDTVAYHRDTLMTWIGNMNSVSAELWLADLHLASGDVATALQLLDNIPNNYSLSTEEQSDVQAYREIANILNGQPAYGLDGATLASVGSYDQSGGNAGGWAQVILTFYGAHYPPRYILSSGIGERSAEGNAKELEETAGTGQYVTVQPNPASGHVEFRLRRPSEGGSTRLVIMDTGGRTVRAFDVPEGVSSMRWETGTNPSGIYFYQLIVEGKALQSGKIILNK